MIKICVIILYYYSFCALTSGLNSMKKSCIKQLLQNSINSYLDIEEDESQIQQKESCGRDSENHLELLYMLFYQY